MELKTDKGYTLMEIMVVITVMATIVAIGSSIFLSILRGSTKAKSISMVKQNGVWALSTMERMIRNARQVEENSGGQVCNTGMNKINILSPDQMETEFACEEIGTTDSRIASNSAIRNTRLTNNEVKVTSCQFNCEFGEGTRPDSVTILFTLTQNLMTSKPEEQVSVDFQTTVSLRNY